MEILDRSGLVRLKEKVSKLSESDAKVKFMLNGKIDNLLT